MEFLGTGDVTMHVIASCVVVLVSTASIALVLFRRRDKQTSSTHSSAVPTSDLRRGDSKQEGDKAMESVLDQMGQTERLQLQSRVANAKCAEDLYLIFDDFSILHNMDLRGAGGEDATPEQAFRDLVRDKITLNHDCVLVTAEHTSSPAVFRQYFHGLVLALVQHQEREQEQEQDLGEQLTRELRPKGSGKGNGDGNAKGMSKRQHQEQEQQQEAIATHLCCHLARTRAGGDAFFCVSDLFRSPQLIITVSHTDTHPPTELHTTSDGWAFITTTSNFDVYLASDLEPPEPPASSSSSQSMGGGTHAEAYLCSTGLAYVGLNCSDDPGDLHGGVHKHTADESSSSSCRPASGGPGGGGGGEEGGGMPLPLVTLSARLEEAIPVTPSAQQEVFREEREREGGEGGVSFSYSCAPAPYYRAMSVVCFHPCDPTRFRGGGGGKTTTQSEEEAVDVPVERVHEPGEEEQQQLEGGGRREEGGLHRRCSPLVEARSSPHDCHITGEAHTSSSRPSHFGHVRIASE